MNLVADTHALVWYLDGRSKKLSRRAHAAFVHADEGRWTVFIPAAVLFELVLLEQGGVLRTGYAALRAQLDVRPGFPIVPVTPEDIDEARSLGALIDPFDRLIAGTARRLDAPLITMDTRITDSGLVRTHW
jgi:PIN domain nuclease of toxin-antitoxin system